MNVKSSGKTEAAEIARNITKYNVGAVNAESKQVIYNSGLSYKLKISLVVVI